MENDDGKTNALGTSTDDIESRCAVNSLILDYYKKFGKKRDLEQFFSLSTAQSDIRDTSGLFWRKMKSENDSSDSGEHKSNSDANELCRISIRCSMPDPSSSQSDDTKTKTESPNTSSPPIITEDPLDIRQADNETFQSDDNHSQKSFDPLLDLSAHKPLSPTSSITSQRKLEWDSLADVGYAYESERKTSGSTLSTLERLALRQQYSNNDTKQDIGSPTCHSTPLDENEGKSKTKKSTGRMTKITKKDFDFVELNLPHTSDTKPHQSIQVNLTKHISFHLEKDGEVTVDNIRRDVNISPEKLSDETSKTLNLPMDNENQTSLLKTNDRSVGSSEGNKPVDLKSQKIPVMISLNTLRKKIRRKKWIAARRKLKTKRKKHESKGKLSQEKSGSQLSEAESFEYMPGHIYKQNQLKARDVNESKPSINTTTGNKSSLESSAGRTTDSSNGSKHSFTKDLEKCIEVLKLALQKRYDDSELKKKLVKEIVQRLLDSKYRDDTSSDFLSGLSFSSKNNDLKSSTTTSTSDANNTDCSKRETPRKSILRMEKFDSKPLASTSQSVPNLPTAANPENIKPNFQKKFPYNSASDESNRWKTSSENAIPKTSSEELYLKYLEALKREESYKKQLKDKARFLKQKLASSETAIKTSMNQESQMNNRLKQLMKDLTRNNCDDGSGDASKVESGSISDRNMKTSHPAKSQRSHSVFTLSSSFSEPHNKNIKKKHFDQDIQPGTSRNHYCCCPHHGVTSKVGYCDSSVQVNIQYQHEEQNNEKQTQDLKKHCQRCNHNISHMQPIANNIIPNQSDKCQSYANPSKTEGTSTNYPNCRHQSNCTTCSDVEIYDHIKTHRKISDKTTNESNNDKDIDECMVCKCCKVPKHGIEDSSNINNANTLGPESSKVSSGIDRIQFIRAPSNLDNISTSSNSNHYSQRNSKSSQTKLLPRMTSPRKNENSSDPANSYRSSIQCALGSEVGKQKIIIHEATRCIQTEISIDPKISDPSLADINIINNCAELIGLKSREIITNTLDEIKTFTDVYTSSESGKLALKSDDGFFQHEIKESDLNIIESKDSNFALTKTMPKDYTIPIKGTNMTLMVSLAASDSKQSNQKVDQQVGTHKAPMKEDGTSISLECAKSIQCDYFLTNILKNNKTSADYNLNKSSKVDKISPRKSSPSPTRSPQRNTYPKIVKIKEKKPFRRANTDTGKLKTCCVQTESSYEPSYIPSASKKLVEKVTTRPLKNQESEINMDTKMLVSDINDEKFLQETKEIGIQKYLSDLENKEFKSVGTDIAILDQGLEVSCQTDICEPYQENVQQKNIDDKYIIDYNTVTEDNIGRDGTSKPHGSKQKQCAACSLNVCQCGIDQKSSLKKNTGSRSEVDVESNVSKDPIMTVIQDITRRYSKGDVTKLKKKKCFNEIVSVLNYLLETEEISDPEPKSAVSITPESSDNSKKSLSVKIQHQGDDNKKKSHSESAVHCDKAKKKVLRTSESESIPSKHDKSVQQSSKSTSKCTESSDMPCSTDRPSTSDSTACKIFNKIKKECEKYHMRRKCGRKCEISSSTSVNCNDCKKVHHCGCRHKCKRSKIVDKLQKKCVAYNLILQTSESMLSEETVCDNSRPLPNVVVKVPKRKDKYRTETCKETIFRIEKGLKDNSSPRVQRSKSCHKDSEVSSNDDFIRRTHCTVREYLEKNRPDFVEKSGERQNCLKFINEIRANERAAHRNLLSLQVDKEPDLTTLTSEQLRDLATQIGIDIRRKKAAPKFISEREMKKHSEKIYKTLPEVVQKKEDKKKENIKKTNLLMANIFKKNLQKKTLRGSVNLSNYSTVIKI